MRKSEKQGGCKGDLIRGKRPFWGEKGGDQEWKWRRKGAIIQIFSLDVHDEIDVTFYTRLFISF